MRAIPNILHIFIAGAGGKLSNERMKLLCTALVASAVALALSAQDTGTPVPLKIGTGDASGHYDQEMIITGKVAQVTIRPTVTFLNLDKPYPNSPFTVVIFPKQRPLFGDLDALRRKSIEIRGTIKKYNDKPEIVLDKTNQLTVFGLTNWPAPLTPPMTDQPAGNTNAVPSTQTTNFPDIM